MDDVATAGWGEGQSGVANIDVLANDSLPAGTATLSVSTAPTHGRVTVQGSQLQYTPDPGYLGADSIGYQVDVGGLRGTATLRIMVQGTLALRGTIKGLSSLPEMAVVAQVGDKSSTGTVSNNSFAVLVTSANPADVVTVTAMGTGANAAKALRSVVGNMGTLAQTRMDGYDTTAKAALDLHVLNTARYGLLKQRGALPADGGALRDALAKLNQIDVYETAIIVNRAIATDAPMPAGVANTAELAASVQALSTLRGSWATSSTAPWDIQSDAGPAALARQLVASTPPAIGPQGARLAIHDPTTYKFTSPFAVNTVLDLRPDGSATAFVNIAVSNTSRIEGQWARTDTSVEVTLSQPILVQYYNASTGPSYWAKRIRLHAYRWGDSPESWLMMSFSGNVETCSIMQHRCDDQGPFNLNERPVRSFEVSRDRLPFRAEDFAAGSRWAGAEAVAGLTRANDGTNGASCLCTSQVLSFSGTPDAAGLSGELTSTGQWKLAGNGFNYRYTRLWQGDDGVEYWLAEVEQAGTLLAARVRAVAKAADVGALTTAQLARRWAVITEPERQDPSAYSVSVDGHDPSAYSVSAHGHDPSGTSLGLLVTLSDPPAATSFWSLGSDGKTLNYFIINDHLDEVLQIVGKTRDGYLALYTSPDNGSIQTSSLVRLRDLGPAP